MASSPRVVRFGVFEADLQTRELRKHGRQVKLQEQPFQVLACLLERPGEMVTREELRQKLWPSGTFVDYDNSMNAAVNRLREALDDSAETPRFVETLPRRGYRFIAPVAGSKSPEPGAVASPPISAPPAASPGPTEAVASAVKPDLTQVGHRKHRLFWFTTLGAVAALLLAGAGVNLRKALHLSGTPARERIRSIAVLPLTNLSGDPAQEYFSDGMTDALITDLARIKPLRVVSRTSSMRYKGSGKPLSQIARELDVEGVVEGSVLRLGERVRITAQLIDAAHDEHLWADRYEGDLRDALTLQRTMTEAIARQVQASLEPEGAREDPHRLPNGAAYDDYLRGLFHEERQTLADNDRAIALFTQAVAEDPGFAAAYAQLALTYAHRTFYFVPRDTQPKERAFAAVEKALILDPGLAENHLARGILLWTHDNHFPHAQAAAEQRQALLLNPNLDEAHEQLALIYLHVGLLDRASAESQRAVAINPLNNLARYRAAIALLYQCRFAPALDALEQLPRSGNRMWNYQYAWVLFHLGRKREAAAAVEAAVKERPEGEGGLLASMQAMMAADAGDAAGAEAHVRSAVDQGRGFGHFHHTAYGIASAYALLGRPEPAVRWLRTAEEEGFPCYPLFASDPVLNRVRRDPAFVAMLADLKTRFERFQAMP